MIYEQFKRARAEAKEKSDALKKLLEEQISEIEKQRVSEVYEAAKKAINSLIAESGLAVGDLVSFGEKLGVIEKFGIDFYEYGRFSGAICELNVMPYAYARIGLRTKKLTIPLRGKTIDVVNIKHVIKIEVKK